MMLLPFSVWEYSTGFMLKFDLLSMATLAYVVIFPSTLAYLVLQPRSCVDRPEPRRAVLSSGAGVRLGDGDRAARRAVAVISSGRLCAGAGRRGDRIAQGLGESLRSGDRGALSGFRFDPGQASLPANPSTSILRKRPYDRTIEATSAHCGGGPLIFALTSRGFRAGSLSEPQHHAGAAVRRRQRHRHHDAPDRQGTRHGARRKHGDRQQGRRQWFDRGELCRAFPGRRLHAVRDDEYDAFGQSVSAEDHELRSDQGFYPDRTHRRPALHAGDQSGNSRRTRWPN